LTRGWLEIHRGEAPLVVSFPHTGTDLPVGLEDRYVSPWLARKDTDWWIDRLYDFAAGLGATTIRTSISRSIVDVNRPPSGASLYPGQATTELCPAMTFDGEPLYRSGQAPNAGEIAARCASWFKPYHDALEAEIARLRERHERVVLYDAHSIRSVIPRLFAGELRQFNLGVNGGASCDPALTAAVEAACDMTGLSRVTDGRFKGGWITRRFGAPAEGVHAIQMELACRGYMAEPAEPLTPANWPAPFRPETAASLRAALIRVLQSCLSFARS
jgi:formiminoglutamase